MLPSGRTQIGVLVPNNFRVESAQQVRDLNADRGKLGGAKYLLKSIPYDPAHRGDLFTLPAKPAALDRSALLLSSGMPIITSAQHLPTYCH